MQLDKHTALVTKVKNWNRLLLPEITLGNTCHVKMIFRITFIAAFNHQHQGMLNVVISAFSRGECLLVNLLPFCAVTAKCNQNISQLQASLVASNNTLTP